MYCLSHRFGKIIWKIFYLMHESKSIFKTFFELKLDFVCARIIIIPSRYLELANPAMTARIQDFCLLKTVKSLQHNPVDH